MSNVEYSALFVIFLDRIPLIITLLVGLIIAIIRWKKHPAVSTLVEAIFVIEMFLVLPVTVLSTLLPLMLARDRMLVMNYSWIIAIAGWMGTLASLAGWILALVAIFGWRSAPQQIKQN